MSSSGGYLSSQESDGKSTPRNRWRKDQISANRRYSGRGLGRRQVLIRAPVKGVGRFSYPAAAKHISN